MSLNELAKVVAYGAAAPGARMEKFTPSGQKVGRVVSFALGVARDVWLDRISTVEFGDEFHIPDHRAGKKRRIVVKVSLGLSENRDQLDVLARQLLNDLTLEDLVNTEIRSTVSRHFQEVDNFSKQQNPVFPALADCRNKLSARIRELGLRVASDFQISIVPNVDVRNEVIEIKEFPVTPVGGSGRHSIHIIITLESPPVRKPSEQLLTWLLNDTPVRGSANSVEAAVLVELRARLDNHFTTQDLRRHTRQIAEKLTREVSSVIEQGFGFQVTLNIFEPARSSETFRYSGTHKVMSPLLGTGREAEFEIEYAMEAFDDDKFLGAFEADRKSSAAKQQANELLSSRETAALSGDIGTWANALVKSFTETELKNAVSEIEVGRLPKFGLLPEDASLSPDDRINELLMPICAAYGFEVRIRTAAIVDRRLHQLKNGIPIDTEMLEYDLAVTTIRPKLRFTFNAFLPDDSRTDLLNQYFQSTSEDRAPFGQLRLTLANRMQNVAATELVQLQTDEYLDMTGDTGPLREKIETKLANLLREEFGLSLRPPLAVQTDPDSVQKRYNDMRSKIRTTRIPLRVISDRSGDMINLTITLSYQVDRLANPNLDEDSNDAGAIAAWEQFRTMALEYSTLDEHLIAFERVMAEAVRGRLEAIPAESFTKEAVGGLRPQITKGFRAAGKIFGLHISVFEDTINIDADDGSVIGGATRIDRQRKRILRLEQILENLEHKYDEIRFGDEERPKLSFLEDDDVSSEDDQKEKLRKQIEEVEEALKQEHAKFVALKSTSNPSLPNSSEAKGD